MLKFIKRISVLLAVVFSISAAGALAEDVDIVSQSAVKSSGSVAGRLLTGSYTIKMELKNSSAKAQNLSLMVIKFSGDVCKGVIIGDSVSVEALATETVTADCNVENESGIDSLKCIVVEEANGAWFPVNAVTKQFTKKGWS